MASLQKHSHYSEEWVKALQFSLLGRKILYLRSGALKWRCQALVTPSWWNPVIRECFLGWEQPDPWRKAVLLLVNYCFFALNDSGGDGAVAITKKLPDLDQGNSRNFRHDFASWGLVLDIPKSKDCPFLHGQLPSVGASQKTPFFTQRLLS